MVNINRSAGTFYSEINEVAKPLEIIERIADISPLPLRIRQRNGIAKRFHFRYAIGPNLECNGFLAAAGTNIVHSASRFRCRNPDESSISLLHCGRVTV